MTPSKKVAKTVTPSKKVAKTVTPSKKVAKTKPRNVKDVQELRDLVVMSPIEYFEMTAKQDDSGEKKDDAEVKPAFMLKIGHPSDGIAFRVVVEVANGKGHIRVGAGVIYSTKKKEVLAPISEEIGLEFANRVAVLALFPYLREAVANLSWRVLGHSITLPMIRAGELQFSPMNEQEVAKHAL